MNLSENSLKIINDAISKTLLRKRVLCEIEDLLERILTSMNYLRAAKIVNRYLDEKSAMPFQPVSADLCKDIKKVVLPLANEIAARANTAAVELEHILGAILHDKTPLDYNLKEKIIKILELGKKDINPADEELSLVPADSQPKNSQDICRFIRKYDTSGIELLVNRPDLIKKALIFLTNNSAVLVGPPGSGRKSLLKLIANAIHTTKWQISKQRVIPIELDIFNLIAGTSYRGELEERILKISKMLCSYDGLPLLFIDDITHLSQSGNGGNQNIAAAFLPYLNRKAFRIIGTATQDSFRERLEKDVAFLHYLSRVDITSSRVEQSKHLLAKLPTDLKQKLDISISPEMIKTSVELCCQYLPHYALPGAAVKLVEDAAARLSIDHHLEIYTTNKVQDSQCSAEVVKPEKKVLELKRIHLLKALSERHKIPFYHLNSGVSDRISNLRKELEETVFGQDKALEKIFKAVDVASKALPDPGKPLGRMFFVGPPGTGKTECAKMLSKHLMGSESALLRINMSEYSDHSGVSSLIGSDKGLVGSTEGGFLTEPLRQNPHRVILFDEIEKAHRSVYSLLLPALDEGMMYDKLGNSVSFRHSYIIFTSNAGFEKLLNSDPENRDEHEKLLIPYFSTEFIDRQEHIVVFQPLDKMARLKICELKLQEIRKILSVEHSLGLSWDSQVVEEITQNKSAGYGARDILRYMTDHIKPQIARCLFDLEDVKTYPIGIKIYIQSNRIYASPLFKKASLKSA